MTAITKATSPLACLSTVRRRVYRFFCVLHRIAKSPALNLCSGFVLVTCGMSEVLAAFFTEWGLVQYLGAHHGVAFFGFLEMAKAMPDVMRGLNFVEEGEEIFGIPASLHSGAPK
jgi:hypothetical protein